MARNKNIVTLIEEDGEYIKAQFVRANGEVVIGDFKRIGWSKAPQAVVDDVTERLRSPAISTVLLGRR
jgi:hypothetical protein